MSYTKTFSQLSSSEWKKVEQFIDADYDLKYEIEDSIYLDMKYDVSSTYNGKGNKCFKCKGLTYDGEDLEQLDSFELDLKYINSANKYFGGIEYYYNNEHEYDSRIYDEDFSLVDITVSLVPYMDIENFDIEDCIRFKVNISIVNYHDGNYVNSIVKNDLCTRDEFEARYEKLLEKYGFDYNYLDIVEMMDGAIDIIVDRFKVFESDVIDYYAKLFALSGDDFQDYMSSTYPYDSGVVFDENGNVEEIIL